MISLISRIARAGLLAAAAALFVPYAYAFAGTGTPSPDSLVPPPPPLPAIESYVLMDYDSGQVLAEKDDQAHAAPASLTKLMVAYLTYQAIQHHMLSINQVVPVSTTAWRTPGSRMFIQPGLAVNVDQLLHGLIIDSGNDAAVSLAQAVAGSRAAFVAMMNETARRLGLNDTRYVNVTGLPAPDLYTSALDVARLSRALIESYPQIINVSSEKYYRYNNIRQPTWNPVLFRDPTVDGLKTGLTDSSGYCIDATALRNGRRLIAVVMHGPSWKGSTSGVESLLDYGTRFFEDRTLYSNNEPVVTLTQIDLNPLHLPAGAGRAVTVTVPRGSGLQVHWQVESGLQGAVRAGQVLGRLTFSASGQVLKSVPLVALKPARRVGIIGEWWNRLRLAV
ncbi:MAG: D-alanyl-D-alanine carboxypeptidase [Gammaproteobacteria bacterium]|nr:D-alanyl-D-alanine carboxypeptidase [Gammaproteobacteria bacterium]